MWFHKNAAQRKILYRVSTLCLISGGSYSSAFSGVLKTNTMKNQFRKRKTIGKKVHVVSALRTSRLIPFSPPPDKKLGQAGS
jgi:hypothetical protein